MNAASTATFAASSSSQPSQVITSISLTNQLSQLSIQETQRSSQSVTQPSMLQSTQLSTHDTQYKPHTQYTQEEATSSQRKQKQKSSYRPVPQSSHQHRTTPAPAPVPLFDKANSEQSSFPHSAPAPAPAPILAEPSHPSSSSSWWSPFSSWITAPPPQRHGRLYRTKSGNLVTAADIRLRRERENELLDMILEGFCDEQQSHTITFYMDEVGRWRIVRQVPLEVETYEVPRLRDA
ncbi:hypothetical protein M434DRAFT_244471 [Hypoxylon sp. CO27-5]|nr:hypothetical protein M434DRAFT_244471 [Hypoxylon sp. CO27-5]